MSQAEGQEKKPGNNGGGRPKKLTKKIIKEKLPEIIEAKAKNLSNADIAKMLGVSRSTLYKYMEKFPDLVEALDFGREICIEELENTLFKSAMGFFVEEKTTTVTKGPDGVVSSAKVTKRYIPPKVGANIFILERLRHELYGKKNEDGYADDSAINITVQRAERRVEDVSDDD